MGTVDARAAKRRRSPDCRSIRTVKRQTERGSSRAPKQQSAERRSGRAPDRAIVRVGTKETEHHSVTALDTPSAGFAKQFSEGHEEPNARTGRMRAPERHGVPERPTETRGRAGRAGRAPERLSAGKRPSAWAMDRLMSSGICRRARAADHLWVITEATYKQASKQARCKRVTGGEELRAEKSK